MGKEAALSDDEIKDVSQRLDLLDPDWAELTGELARILDKSNAAYGSSTVKSAKIMEILWPEGVPVDRMHDARCMISILDKLSRIATDKDAFGECPWRDVGGYALLAYREDLKKNREREK